MNLTRCRMFRHRLVPAELVRRSLRRGLIGRPPFEVLEKRAGIGQALTKRLHVADRRLNVNDGRASRSRWTALEHRSCAQFPYRYPRHPVLTSQPGFDQGQGSQPELRPAPPTSAEPP